MATKAPPADWLDKWNRRNKMPLLARALFSVRNDGSVSFPRIDGSIPATFSLISLQPLAICYSSTQPARPYAMPNVSKGPG